MCCNIKQHHKAHSQKVFRLGHPQPHPHFLGKKRDTTTPIITQDRAHNTTSFATRVTTPKAPPLLLRLGHIPPPPHSSGY